MNIADNIRQYRILRGLSQSRVAQYLNIKVGTYQAYEAGRAEPSIETLCELRDLYGLPSVDALIEGNSKPVINIDTRYRQLSARDKRIVDAVMGTKC